MGSLESLIGMLPGMNKAMSKGMKIDNNAFVSIEAIINSMTKKERSRPVIINGSRRKRIANGSGTSVQQVNQLLKQFTEMKKMMKKFTKMSPKQLGRMGLPF